MVGNEKGRSMSETKVQLSARVSTVEQVGPDQFDRQTRVRMVTEDMTVGELLKWAKRTTRLDKPYDGYYFTVELVEESQ
jgi:hypothetical protein